MKKRTVGILGATGSVGQRFVQLLADHPWFTITAVCASERSAGKRYADAVSWKQATPIPEAVRDLPISSCEPELNCDFVFSGLDASVAGEIEEAFAAAGYPVISNSKNHRMAPDVPLLVADINPEHIALIDIQKKNRGFTKGYLVTNPNCSTIGLVTALKPLYDAFGIESVFVVTMQAVSGAGYPGISSMDILDNVVPYIGNEDDKIESEPLKILGSLTDETLVFASFGVSATANRVPVVDGHTGSVFVKLKKPASPEEAATVLRDYSPGSDFAGLPFMPERTILVADSPDRPQPRLDRDVHRGMSVTVGRVRKCPQLDLRFTFLVHNTIRGAAGTAILNAELLLLKGYL
ncbi:MAG: aspartate-semialdehyde dehydrogenase [Patescibacteria group bacterium]|nr:aspartate-semialdehyde dehydrogenase [Patescibacteria group bacterium]